MGDLALERRIEQILITLDLDVADQLGIHHEYARNLREWRHPAIRHLDILVERRFLGRVVNLEELLRRAERRHGAPPHHVAQRISRLSLDTLEQFARTGGHDFGLNACRRLEFLDQRLDEHERMRTIDHQLL